jgi:hypothetical protein
MMHDWNLGIFAFIAVLIGIVGSMLALRLAYIHAQYNNIIKDYEKTVKSYEEKGNINDSIDADRKNALLGIGRYETLKEQNNTMGLGIDAGSILSMLVIMALLIYEIFVDSISYILVILVMLFLVSFANFLWHIKNLNPKLPKLNNR